MTFKGKFTMIHASVTVTSEEMLRMFVKHTSSYKYLPKTTLRSSLIHDLPYKDDFNKQHLVYRRPHQ